MIKSDQFIVEAHFVPFPEHESDERKQRFRALLLQGAFRLIQRQNDSNGEGGKPEAPKPLLVELGQE